VKIVVWLGAAWHAVRQALSAEPHYSKDLPPRLLTFSNMIFGAALALVVLNMKDLFEAKADPGLVAFNRPVLF